MAHYPTVRKSKLSLDSFLLAVMRHNISGEGTPKGIKLDFKRIGCVASGMATLVHLHEQLSAEIEAGCLGRLLPVVFVNADIARGPCLVPTIVGRWQEPLPPFTFVQAVTSVLAACKRPWDLNVALSLGWTMGLHIRSGCVLSAKMVDVMLGAVHPARAAVESGLLRHITVAVSAALAPASCASLARVLDAAGAEASLTFFTPTFGRGVTRKEAEVLLAYPLCPPHGLFLDIKCREGLGTPKSQACLSLCSLLRRGFLGKGMKLEDREGMLQGDGAEADESQQSWPSSGG